MNALVLVVVAIVALVLGYVLYGRWLSRQWGINPFRPTPANKLEDGVDFVPAPLHVVFGQHFSSIAGIGSVYGPIQAALFGWVPVALWIIVGGIFFGAAHDFGSLFASLRHRGSSLAAVVRDNLDDTAKRLFCIFAFLLVVLLVAAFSSIAASSFQVNDAQSAAVNMRNSQAAVTALLFIVAAFAWGLVTRGRRIPAIASIACAIMLTAAIVAAGINIPVVIPLDHGAWMVILGIYVLVSAVTPMWILLQPRDYLSSFLLYGLIILAIVGVVGMNVTGSAVEMQIPAFSGLAVNVQAFDVATGTPLVDTAGAPIINQVAQGGFLLPTLFVVVSCGAISGFHSLVASGTTSKQLDQEPQALHVGFGAMLVESLLAILALCAVGFVWVRYAAGDYSSPMQVFSDGVAGMLVLIPGLENAGDIVYSLLTLAVSALCLTTLDTATRLARYLFQELWVPVGKKADNLEGWRKVLANRNVATVITVVLSIGLGMTGYTVVWPLFGTANQLLAAFALLTVCAWLGNAGRNNNMLYIPMVFMFVVAFASLLLTIQQKAVAISFGGDVLVPGVQLVIAVALLALAVFMVVKSVKASRA